MTKVLALATPTLLALAGIPASTLNYWVSRGFCTPTLDAGTGNRATRYWTVRDVLVIRAVKRLRDAGCSLQNVAQVEFLLSEHLESDLAQAVLIYDGRDVIVKSGSDAVSLLAQTGQGVFVDALTMVTVPLGPWKRETELKAEKIDVEEIRNRRVAAKQARGVA